MKVECLKDKLKEAVFITERVTGKNLALPILSSVFLQAEKNRLFLRATNLDIGVEIDIPARVEAPGSVTLNASVLSNFLGNLYKEDRVVLELKNDNIHVSTPRSSTLIKSFPADDFPIIPRVTDGGQFTISAENLVAGLKSVAYAAALSDIKPEISSVYLYPDQGQLVFVATDSFRLAEKRVAAEGLSEVLPTIIPHKNVAELIRVFDTVSGEVVVYSGKHQISFFADGIHFTSRVIDGIYPDYRQIMPKQFLTEVLLEKEELMQLLKLSNVFSDKFNQIDISVEPTKSSVEITARSQDVGENQASMKVRASGEPIQMSFNGKYVLDAFPVLASSELSLRFNERNRPMLITGTSDPTFRYIVMPINR